MLQSEDRTAILLVDAREPSRIALANALSSPGYDILQADSGSAALTYAQRQEFALILLSAEMPNLDGFETAQQIKKTENSKSTPIILIADPERVGALLHSDCSVGAVDFLSRPLNSQILRSKVAVFVEMHTRMRCLQASARRDLAARDYLMSVASHELKTPITTLGLQLQMLRKYLEQGASNDFIEKKLLTFTRDSFCHIRRISKLVDNLMDISKINHGQFSLALEPVDLELLIHELISQFQYELMKSECQLKLNIERKVVGIWDRVRLERAITNLLTNAIKYGKGAPIEITLTCQEAKCLLQIKDNGIGIAPQDQVRIFDRFERAVSSPQFEGLGLGLFITKEIVHAMQGKIWVESTFGVGSSFFIELPQTAVSKPPLSM